MSLADRAYSEKRNFIRMQIDTPISVQVETHNENITGLCRDLSGGGMLVELEKALPVGSQMKVEINSPHGHEPMLQAKTRVTRVLGGPNDRCILGMEIEEMLS